ncbi:MAG: 2-dehydropantoate 2-reductase [Microbacteriaceae bacterium]|nr:2-dehydropantoate 2-reductase [Microbacteriaceae bacterium]
MRVAVIGAGAIGGTIAALLAREGHDVTIVARGANLETIARHGIHLRGAWGDFTARVTAVPRLVTTPEIAFVATKAQDARAALADQAPFLGGLPLVVVQNGLEGLQSARLGAPRADVIGALALYAASYLSPGEVTITAPGETYLGGPVIASLYASRLLGSVMPIVLTDNFEGAQWTKLIINHVNALPAITGLSVQQVVANRALRVLMTESMREAARVGFAKGITFEKISTLSNGLLRLLVRLPASFGQLLPWLMARRMGSTPNPGSTLQSIRRHQPTEIDYLNGAVVRLGKTVDVPTPVSATIVDLVHEVERSGQFMAPDAVLARF